MGTCVRVCVRHSATYAKFLNSWGDGNTTHVTARI